MTFQVGEPSAKYGPQNKGDFNGSRKREQS
jgi:hypothetical protein